MDLEDPLAAGHSVSARQRFCLAGRPGIAVDVIEGGSLAGKLSSSPSSSSSCTSWGSVGRSGTGVVASSFAPVLRMLSLAIDDRGVLKTAAGQQVFRLVHDRPATAGA